MRYYCNLKISCFDKKTFEIVKAFVTCCMVYSWTWTGRDSCFLYGFQIVHTSHQYYLVLNLPSEEHWSMLHHWISGFTFLHQGLYYVAWIWNDFNLLISSLHSWQMQLSVVIDFKFGVQWSWAVVKLPCPSMLLGDCIQTVHIVCIHLHMYGFQKLAV